MCFEEFSIYTLEKCRRYSIPTRLSSEQYYWNKETHSWGKRRFELPCNEKGEFVIFTPEAIVNRTVSLANFRRFAVMGIVKFMIRNSERINIGIDLSFVNKENGKKISQKDFIPIMKDNGFSVYDRSKFLSLDKELQAAILLFYEGVIEENN